MQPFPYLLDKAYTILTRRDHSIAELKQKLRRAMDAAPIFSQIDDADRATLLQLVVEKLIDLNLLDDARFARLWIGSRKRLKPRGRYMLQQELRQKGVAEEVIEAALREMIDDEEELEQAVLLLKKRARKTPEQNTRYLQSKGFSFAVIMKALRQTEPKTS